MAKKNAAVDSGKPRTPRQGFASGASGKRYVQTKSGFQLDGFIYVGSKDEPIFCEIECIVRDAVTLNAGAKDAKGNSLENKFLVVEVVNVDGDAQLTQQGSDEMFVPENWPGLRCGMTVLSSMQHLMAPEFKDKQVLVKYGDMQKNTKTKRMYRDVEVFVADSDATPEQIAAAESLTAKGANGKAAAV